MVCIEERRIKYRQERHDKQKEGNVRGEGSSFGRRGNAQKGRRREAEAAIYRKGEGIKEEIKTGRG